MSGMDEFLANYYGTAGGGTQSTGTIDKEAEASFELFAKVAAAEGIDLSKMSDEDVMALYTKVAGDSEGEDEEKKEEEKKEKEAAAKAELAAKTASSAPEAEAQEKIAEADFLGRVMAHAYVQEMKKIAEAGSESEEPSEQEKVALSLKTKMLANLEKAKRGVGAAAHRGKELLTGSKHKNLEHAAGTATSKGKQEGEVGSAWRDVASRLKRQAKTEGRKVMGTRAGVGAAAVGAAAAGAHHGMKEKKGSALDELAADLAMSKIAASGYDTDQGADLLSNLLASGASEENTKIAAANGDLEGALEIRSLELLEQVGYPVQWTE